MLLSLQSFYSSGKLQLCDFTWIHHEVELHLMVRSACMDDFIHANRFIKMFFHHPNLPICRDPWTIMVSFKDTSSSLLRFIHVVYSHSFNKLFSFFFAFPACPSSMFSAFSISPPQPKVSPYLPPSLKMIWRCEESFHDCCCQPDHS